MCDQAQIVGNLHTLKRPPNTWPGPGLSSSCCQKAKEERRLKAACLSFADCGVFACVVCVGAVIGDGCVAAMPGCVDDDDWDFREH